MATPVTRAFVQFATAALLLVGAFVTYCAMAEKSAERKARAFCGDLRVGASVADLQVRAVTAGASQRLTKWAYFEDGSAWLPVIFTGAFPMSRHICWVTGAPKLETAKYVYLD
jgi:hypothetical protein